MAITNTPPRIPIKNAVSPGYLELPSKERIDVVESEEAVFLRALKIVFYDTVLVAFIFIAIYSGKYIALNLLKIGDETVVQIIFFFSNVLLAIVYVFIVGLHLYRLYKYGKISIMEENNGKN